MSQTPRFPKLTVRNKPGTEGNLTTGANVVIELDGQPVKGCTFLKIELKPNRVAKVVMELVAEVDADVATVIENG